MGQLTLEIALLLQVVLGIILATVSNSVLAVSFGLFYRIEKFFNFAHAGVFALVAYTAAAALRNGTPPILAFTLCCAITVALETIASAAIQLGNRGRMVSGLLGLMLSYSVYLVVQALLTIIDIEFTEVFRTISPSSVASVLGVSIATHQMVKFGTGCMMLAAVTYFFAKTLTGWRVIAAIDDRKLCEILGNDVQAALWIARIVACCFLSAGSFFAASASVLYPEMGFLALQSGIIVWISGGRGTVSMLGSAFALSLLQNLAGWLAPTTFSSAIIYGVLALLAVAKGPFVRWRARLKRNV